MLKLIKTIQIRRDQPSVQPVVVQKHGNLVCGGKSVSREAYQGALCEGKEVVQGVQCLLNKHVDLVSMIIDRKEEKARLGGKHL